jgi:hypothetical protein
MAPFELPTLHGKRGSDRSFGLVFAAFFAIIGLLPWLQSRPAQLWAIAVATAFACAALLAPIVLRPLNRAWFLFGTVLHRLMNPVVMSVIFYGAVLPTAVLLRLLGKDLLSLKREPQSSSYWIVRKPPAPAPGSMTKQF